MLEAKTTSFDDVFNHDGWWSEDHTVHRVRTRASRNRLALNPTELNASIGLSSRDYISTHLLSSELLAIEITFKHSSSPADRVLQRPKKLHWDGAAAVMTFLVTAILVLTMIVVMTDKLVFVIPAAISALYLISISLYAYSGYYRKSK